MTCAMNACSLPLRMHRGVHIGRELRAPVNDRAARDPAIDPQDKAFPPKLFDDRQPLQLPVPGSIKTKSQHRTSTAAVVSSGAHRFPGAISFSVAFTGRLRDRSRVERLAQSLSSTYFGMCPGRQERRKPSCSEPTIESGQRRPLEAGRCPFDGEARSFVSC